MGTRHTGAHVVNNMEMEYHYHPFGDNHLAAKRVVQPLPAAFDSEKRLDYDVRTDDSPVYIGFAEYLFTSATDSLTPSTSTDIWIIQKLTYDGSNRITRIQVARGAWDDRVSLFT
jgi:hypothetical protein